MPRCTGQKAGPSPVGSRSGFWSVNRDNGDCPDGEVQSTCSGIEQTAYEFSSLFADFKK